MPGPVSRRGAFKATPASSRVCRGGTLEVSHARTVSTVVSRPDFQVDQRPAAGVAFQIPGASAEGLGGSIVGRVPSPPSEPNDIPPPTAGGAIERGTPSPAPPTAGAVAQGKRQPRVLRDRPLRGPVPACPLVRDPVLPGGTWSLAFQERDIACGVETP